MSKSHDVHAPGALATGAAQPQSGGALEREADQRADQVMATPPRNTARGGDDGQLDPTLRQDMESHFRHDFSRVQIHADAAAARIAGALDAAAFTFGHHVVFNSGRFAPGTPAGRRLLAHELSHVVQQQRMPAPIVQRQPLGGGADDAKAALTWESYRQSISIEGFDSGSAVLNAAHLEQLDAYKLRLQSLLALYPESFFTVIGHTDATDSASNNQALGQSRADAVKARLTSGDTPVPAQLVSAGSLGETALAVPTPGREARNRRVEIIPKLRRSEMRAPPPTVSGNLGKPGNFGPIGATGPGLGIGKPGPGLSPDPDPLGLRRPLLPGFVLSQVNWLQEGLDRDPVLRKLPPWIGDKVKDVLKDGDEMLAEKIIDALPIDDKARAALQALVKGVLQRAKGKGPALPEAPPKGADFGPQPEFPKFPGEMIVPGPKFKF